MKLIVFSAALVTLSLFSLFSPSQGADSPTSGDQKVTSLHAEILLYEGKQYLHFMSKFSVPGIAIGEQLVYSLKAEPTPMDMYYLGKHENLTFITNCLRSGGIFCAQVDLEMVNDINPELGFSCQFNIERKQGLLWLTDSYTCNIDLDVTIENDNEE